MMSDVFSGFLFIFSHPLLLFSLCVIIGWGFGIFTGMFPGIHVNNVAAVLVGASPLLYAAGLSPLLVSTVILSCAISHTFHNIVPAIFLGAPSEDTALAVLPGHRLLLAGEGYAAVRLSALSSLGSVFFSPVIAVPVAVFLYYCYPVLEPHMGFFLLALSLIILLSEKKLPKIIRSTIVFLASGFLGMLAFRLDGSLNPLLFSSSASVLMPLLSGLFGVPQLVVSLSENSVIPNVRERSDDFPVSSLIKNTAIGTIAGAGVSWIPGISSSVAAILAGIFTGRRYPEPNPLENEIKESASDLAQQKTRYSELKMLEEASAKEFIIVISAINTANAIFGLLAFFIIQKSRSGAVISIRDLLFAAGMTDMTFDIFLLFYAVIFLTGFLSYFSTLKTGVYLPQLLQKMNYRLISFFVLLLLCGLTILMTGSFGFILFIASGLIGFLPYVLNTRKSNLMGVILFPVMLYFLGF
jgi:Predicted membrane protein